MRKLIYLLTCLATIFAVSGQDTKAVRKTFFPRPETLEINTPLKNKKNGYTSYKEMKSFLDKMSVENPELMSVQSVGKTQRGRDIMLVTLSLASAEDKEKMKMLYMARIHGDEPGGTEGLLHFIDQMIKRNDLQILLENIDIHIMPMVNVDGGMKMKRQTANGIDLNRDQVRLESPEAIAIRKVSNLIDPHFYVDFHEYQPLKSAYSLVSDQILTVPWDVMYLTSGNPNVSSDIRLQIDSLILPDADIILKENNYTSHTYYTPRVMPAGVTLNMGGSSPRSTSNSFALNNAYSILIEGRGIGLCNSSIKRRLNTINLLAESFARMCSQNKDSLLSVLSKAENDRKPVAVKFASQKSENVNISFINELKNRIDTIPMLISNAMDTNVISERELADCYYILPSEVYAIKTLKNLGIFYDIIEEDITLPLGVYSVKTANLESNGFKTFTPLSVAVDLSVKEVTLPIGTIKVSTSQKRFRLLSVMLEPESSNGFVNYRIIEAKEGADLPYYRSVNK